MEVCNREQIMVSKKIYIFTSILIDLKDIFFFLDKVLQFDRRNLNYGVEICK